MLGMLFISGCAPRVVPDERIPHRVAKATEATVWARGADGRIVETLVEVPAGWWVVSDRIVNP